MPRRIFATQLLDKLPQQLAPQSVPRTSDRPGFFDTPVEKSGLFSETGNERTAAPQLAIGRRSDNRRDLGKTRLNHLYLFKGHNSPPG
jgi:hypothetical protein